VVQEKKVRPFVGIMVCVSLVGFAYLARGLYYRTMTTHHVLAENRELKRAITNITREDQIGYAKVVSQTEKDGRIFTTIKFVETARDDKLRKILEKEYTIEGDIVYFDSLIVKFGNKMVTDGKAKALYLWRRVYGEKMTPEEAFSIEEPGVEPLRYSDLLAVLPLREKKIFWDGVWDLANDTEKLSEYGIRAIYGNVVYSRLREGLIYVFKIDATGHVYPEVVPDM